MRAGMGKQENEYRVGTLKLSPLGGGKRLGRLGRLSNLPCVYVWLAELSNTPCLCAYSFTVAPQPKEWSNKVITTGWWFDEEEKAEYVWNTHLENFLSKGNVICIAFGSMSRSAHHFNMFELVLKGLVHGIGKEKLRVLIVDSEGQKIEWLGEARKLIEIEIVKEAPYEVLFPRCIGVIHHGGAGTCAKALHTKTPSIIIPILLWTDQPFWAERLQAVQVAIHIKRLSPTFIHDITSSIPFLTTNSPTESLIHMQSQLHEEGNGAILAVDQLLSRTTW